MSAIRHDHAGGQAVYGVAVLNEGPAHTDQVIATAWALEPSVRLRDLGGMTAWDGWEQPAADGLVARLRPRLDAAAKRAFDVAVALFLLLFGLPLWAVIALGIALTSPGPVFFRQQRCGRGRRVFTCYKFRTMVVDAERRLREDATLAAAHAGQWKLHDDPRVTAVGRLLRKTSLDELPQLWNVLRGEMSLVGPRPVQPRELTDVYGALAETVTSVRPGLTGLWQVSGRSALSYDQRVALDLAYVRRRGFWYDLWLILKTVPAVLWGKGAV
ncbi:MAG TPA: sugar transferase [Thermomicrobiales bacterium]|jgi:lipopolysaccharide/colanic/teichoic acid biosynthesis glycosyltransferase